MHTPQLPDNSSPSRRWTIAILGPGGVGGLLAGVLSRAGHRVIGLAGENTVDVLRRDGVRVFSRQFGDFATAIDADTELHEQVDLCLITVKHTAFDAALERLPAPRVGSAFIVPLLNGVEHLPALRRRYVGQEVAAGVIRVESTRTAPGVIVHGSPFTEIDLAGDESRLSPLSTMLTQAGIPTRLLNDDASVLWSKLAFLAPFALLTTRYGLTIGAVRTRLREELTAVVEEAAAVGRACGAAADPATILAQYAAFPADSKSSMQRDAEAGRPLELDAIGGALLRAAEREGVAVPVTTRLVGELAAGVALTQPDRR